MKYVLEGSIRRADNQVRITAQLVDATTGDHIWAEHYDRALRDIFSLQDEIVRRIVTTLNLQFAVLSRGLSVARRTDNLGAYDYFLRGIEFLRSLNPTKEDYERARQMFEKAVELDPTYSDGYAWLGYILHQVQTNQWRHDPHGFDRALELERQSIVLDNSNAFAYAIMSWEYDYTGQYNLGIRAAERALAFDPNLPYGYAAMALSLSASGKPAEAVVAAQKAMRLDPRNRDVYSVFEGQAYVMMERYEEAIPPLETYVVRHSNAVGVRAVLLACYIEVGRNEEARAEAAEVMRINPEFSLAAFKQLSIIKEPLRDRIVANMAKAGLK